MNIRRKDDESLQIVLARPGAAPQGDSGPDGSGSFFLERIDSAALSAAPTELSTRAEKTLEDLEHAAFLLDSGRDEVLLIVAAAVRRLPRGQGGQELLERAAAGVASWKRERIRTWKRLQLPDHLIAFSEELAGAMASESVWKSLVEHAPRIVGGYVAVLFRWNEDRSLLRAVSSSGTYDPRKCHVKPDARFTRPGLLTAGDVSADTGAPFASLAPIFAETRAAYVAHVPIRSRGVLFLVERRQERVFGPEDWDLMGTLARQAEAALERIRLFEEVRELSLTDPLTGLANRRHMELLSAHCFAAARRGEPLTMVMLDVDDFKSINDQRGHLEGDRILRLVAHCLREQVRGADMVVRYGGDEFLVMLPGEDRKGALALVGRIQEKLAHEVQISFGIAEYQPSIETANDLIQEADRNLYHAKRCATPVLQAAIRVNSKYE